MKILIIDDDQMIVDIWTLALQKNGFEVINGKNGQEGIDAAKEHSPDFIVLDQIMPDMKGNDVLKILKGDPATSPIPVAVASNYSDNELMDESIQIGAVDYILKYQVEPGDLVNKIKSLIQGSKAA